MKRVEQFIVGCLLFATTVAISQTSDTPAPQQSQAQNTPRKSRTISPDGRGQEVFDQNCSRCHHAPEGFPPGVSGTIARHMRVRASLSDEDYKALLKFLNP